MTIAVPSVESQEMTEEAHIPRAQLVRIIKPRVEEILEFVRDRLRKAGLAPEVRPAKSAKLLYTHQGGGHGCHRD